VGGARGRRFKLRELPGITTFENSKARARWLCAVGTDRKQFTLHDARRVEGGSWGPAPGLRQAKHITKERRPKGPAEREGFTVMPISTTEKKKQNKQKLYETAGSPRFTFIKNDQQKGDSSREGVQRKGGEKKQHRQGNRNHGRENHPKSHAS